MPRPRSNPSVKFAQEWALYEAALSTQGGIDVPNVSVNAAIAYRHRLHKARLTHREMNGDNYSSFDPIEITVHGTTLHMERRWAGYARPYIETVTGIKHVVGGPTTDATAIEDRLYLDYLKEQVRHPNEPRLSKEEFLAKWLEEASNEVVDEPPPSFTESEAPPEEVDPYPPVWPVFDRALADIKGEWVPDGGDPAFVLQYLNGAVNRWVQLHPGDTRYDLLQFTVDGRDIRITQGPALPRPPSHT